MKDIAYYNGMFTPIDETCLPINDRGYYFGDGVYEVVYVKDRKPFALADHLARLRISLDLVGIKFLMTDAELIAIIDEALSRVDASDQLIYFQVTRGTWPRIHAFPPEDVPPNLILFSRGHALMDVTAPVSLCTRPDERWSNCHIKSLNLLPNVIAAQYAASKGCRECVLYRDDMVTEGSASNIFILEKGVLRTAPLSNHLLAGITRKNLIILAKNLGITVLEEPFSIQQMHDADEVLFTSTTKPCAYAKSIDGTPAGGRAPELVYALQRAYQNKIIKDTSSA